MGVLACGVLRTTDGSYCSLRNWNQTYERDSRTAACMNNETMKN